MADTSRWLRLVLGFVFLMLSGVFAAIFASMCSGQLTCTTTGMELVPIFPALIGIFLIVHAIVVKGDGVP